MLGDGKAFSGFSVDDIDVARQFYSDALGLQVTDENGMLRLHVGVDRPILVYPKGDAHVPAEYTILNFPVDDIDAAVAGLTARGVRFEKYEGTQMETDATGVFRKGGPLIAWFTDPAGNVMSVIQL
ncbi:MAG: VOC family protein [Aeromicrobium sp.]